MLRTPLKSVGKLLFVGALLLAAPRARALELSVGAGLNFNSLTLNAAQQSSISQQGLSVSAGTGFIGGAMLSTEVAPSLPLEIGAFYASRVTSFTSTTLAAAGIQAGLNLTFPEIEIPVVLRYNFIEYFGLGVGGYYAYQIGNATASGTGALSGQSLTFSNTQTHKNDFGLVFDARGNLPIDATWKLFLDARYNLGLANLNSDGVSQDDFKSREWQFMAGAGYTF